MSSSSNQLGKIIRDLRVAKRISQEALGERAGIHRTYVSQLERGMKSPTIVILQRIAKALEIQASEILKRMEDV